MSGLAFFATTVAAIALSVVTGAFLVDQGIFKARRPAGTEDRPYGKTKN